MEGLTQYHFDCPECGYTDKEAKRLAGEYEKDCPLCFSDCFHLVALRRWQAGEQEKP